ncbi:hypothetical protein MRB53_010699 [Persea americana]|uniref:Uncharacterized protein n=1 Tax=Persea americana TaxID=3435 RepID=A0ACC2LSL1_PERAE|nr:hypothetical protein MRB53_010699 [Persea americana]
MHSSTSVGMSSGHTSTFLISNIGSLISIKLENHYYLLCKSQFLPVWRAHGLIASVDGSSSCLSEFLVDQNGKITDEINPEYSSWIQHDQNFLCWINATLSENVLAHVVGLKTSREVWLALERRFASLSRSHVIQLKTKLQSLKKGSMNITDYLQKIKHIADSLAAVLCPVDEEDLIIHTLNGLPQEYAAFKTSIRTRSSPISLEELHVLLLCEELNIEESHQSVADFSSTALVASKEAGHLLLYLESRHQLNYVIVVLDILPLLLFRNYLLLYFSMAKYLIHFVSSVS